ncbi:MAG: hypothetical protein RIQ50_749 [Bacteroidota bacterium]
MVKFKDKYNWLNQFTIRDIENLTGIKAHTLRTWEKRYGIIIPPTLPGKHRVYDNNDLKHILRISLLYHYGFKISKIADMSVEEMMAATIQIEKKSNFEVFINRLIEFSIDFNEQEFKQLVAELKETMDQKDLIIHVLFPFLVKLGQLWTINSISPVQEHFASTLVRNELIRSINALPLVQRSAGPLVLLFCPHNEHHELPLLFCNYLLRKNKFPTRYLGVNASLESIDQAVKKTQPDVVLAYLITNFTDSTANDLARNLQKACGETKLALAGPGFGPADALPEKTTSIRSLNKLIRFCETLSC